MSTIIAGPDGKPVDFGDHPPVFKTCDEVLAEQKEQPKVLHGGKGTLFIGGQPVGLFTGIHYEVGDTTIKPVVNLSEPRMLHISGTIEGIFNFFRVYRAPWWKRPYLFVKDTWRRARACPYCDGTTVTVGAGSPEEADLLPCGRCDATGIEPWAQRLHRWAREARRWALSRMKPCPECGDTGYIGWEHPCDHGR